MKNYADLGEYYPLLDLHNSSHYTQPLSEKKNNRSTKYKTNLIRILNWKNHIISVSLNQNISKSFNVLLSIVSYQGCIPARVVVIWYPLHSKPDSRITGDAIVLAVSKDTYSCPNIDGCVRALASSVKTLSIAIGLQGSLGAD